MTQENLKKLLNKTIEMQIDFDKELIDRGKLLSLNDIVISKILNIDENYYFLKALKLAITCVTENFKDEDYDIIFKDKERFNTINQFLLCTDLDYENQIKSIKIINECKMGYIDHIKNVLISKDLIDRKLNYKGAELVKSCEKSYIANIVECTLISCASFNLDNTYECGKLVKKIFEDKSIKECHRLRDNFFFDLFDNEYVLETGKAYEIANSIYQMYKNEKDENANMVFELLKKEKFDPKKIIDEINYIRNRESDYYKLRCMIELISNEHIKNKNLEIESCDIISDSKNIVYCNCVYDILKNEELIMNDKSLEVANIVNNIKKENTEDLEYIINNINIILQNENISLDNKLKSVDIISNAKYCNFMFLGGLLQNKVIQQNIAEILDFICNAKNDEVSKYTGMMFSRILGNRPYYSYDKLKKYAKILNSVKKEENAQLISFMLSSSKSMEHNYEIIGAKILNDSKNEFNHNYAYDLLNNDRLIKIGANLDAARAMNMAKTKEQAEHIYNKLINMPKENKDYIFFSIKKTLELIKLKNTIQNENIKNIAELMHKRNKVQNKLLEDLSQEEMLVLLDDDNNKNINEKSFKQKLKTYQGK